MCKLKSLQRDRPAAGDTVNELLFRCATFETKVNPVQSNYNIDGAIKQVLNTEKTGDFIEHGLSVGFYRYIPDVSIDSHVLFTVRVNFTAVSNLHFPCYC